MVKSQSFGEESKFLGKKEGRKEGDEKRGEGQKELAVLLHRSGWFFFFHREDRCE
jgi:hypothetical protein